MSIRPLRIKLSDSAFQELVATLGGSAFHAKRWLDEAEVRCNVELVEALEEQAIVSKANHQAVHRPQDGMGQCMIRMSRKLTHWLRRWQNMLFEKDEQFMKALMRDPDLCLRPQVQQKCTLIKTRYLTPFSTITPT